MMLHPQQAQVGADARVAVLVDCDNTKPDILEFALRVVAKFGRVVLRRGYGNHSTLANKWQEALVHQAFTPCLQYQYAAGKNTADIALALDAIEALLDQRAEIFCLVTSDSDFSPLCRKLRERGAAVHIVGEAKTPDALRCASDQFFEWRQPELLPAPAGIASAASSKPAAAVPPTAAEPTVKPAAKKRPKSLLNAVSQLASDRPDGRVGLGALGQYLKRNNPSFTPKIYGHTALLDMVRCYPELSLSVENGSGHWVSLKPKPEAATSAATA